MRCINCKRRIIVPETDHDDLCADCRKREGERLQEQRRESAKNFWNRT